LLHRFPQAAAARHPDVDVVVNNAGGAVIGALEEVSEADIQQQIALNLLAPVYVTRAFLGALRAKKRGTFIHVSSVGGRAAFPGGSLYHAAKFGLEGFAEAVSQEVAEFGIKTIIIEPGSHQDGLRGQYPLDPGTRRLQGQRGWQAAPLDRGVTCDTWQSSQ
jgi:NAD(P)-dependent dehydrogenase (short-subunit alcohol dehydrogenase family)